MTIEPEFSQTPISLSEKRAEKACDASQWNVRDLLIRALRQIDSGEMDPSMALLIYQTSDGDISYKAAGLTMLPAVGLLEVTKSVILDGE